MKTLLALLAVLALTGCETFEGVRFGVAFAQAETEVGVSFGDGKAVVEAEQGDQRVSGYFRR